MKEGTVFFRPKSGSGSLTISWTSMPKGATAKAEQGNGVGFFSEAGDLLYVIFDEVNSKSDHQTLTFARGYVEITVKDGLVKYAISEGLVLQRKREKRPSKPKTSHDPRSKQKKNRK
jgi:hypothetical protein